MSCLLGIDIGTSSAKCLLVDTSGNQIAVCGSPYPVNRLVPGLCGAKPGRLVGGRLHLHKKRD